MAKNKPLFLLLAKSDEDGDMSADNLVTEDVFEIKEQAVERGIEIAEEGKPLLPFYIAEVYIIERHVPKKTTEVEVLPR